MKIEWIDFDAKAHFSNGSNDSKIFFQILLRDEIAGRMEEMNELCGENLIKAMMADALA